MKRLNVALALLALNLSVAPELGAQGQLSKERNTVDSGSTRLAVADGFTFAPDFQVDRTTDKPVRSTVRTLRPVGLARVNPVRVEPAAAQEVSASAGRQGFIVGIGGGVGTHRRSRGGSPARASLALISDFKVGYATSDQLLMYYRNQSAWGGSGRYNVISMSAFGVTYMLSSESPSAYVSGAVGAATGLSFEDPSGTGPGMSLGGGYEFTQRLSVGGEWMYLDVEPDIGNNVFSFKFDWLHY